MAFDAAKLVAELSESERQLLRGALEQHALLLNIGGEVYAAKLDEPAGGWWVWQLKVGSAEYFVSRRCDRCTCPMQGEECKHRRALRVGGETSHVPWDYKTLKRKRRQLTRKRKGKVRPLQRGEN